jgi:integrase
MTFNACATAYINAHKAGWRNLKHAEQWTNTLATYASPVFGALPVSAIDTGLVMKAIEPLWQTKTETATRLRGRIESILGWATVRGYRTGENPARWRGHLDKLLPKRSKVAKVKHHAALAYTQIPEFMRKLREREGVTAKALEFIILTAARVSEAVNARWDEIDGKAAVWTVPASRMKSGREHRVPLTKEAGAVLGALEQHRQSDYVFPGWKVKKPLTGAACLELLKDMGHGDLTTHGFRSTFRDWAAEQTAFPREIAEAALAHTLRDKVEAAYQRGDLLERRRKLMEAWAAYCAKPEGQVIPIQNRSQTRHRRG